MTNDKIISSSMIYRSESLLIDKILHDLRLQNTETITVSDFIETIEVWVMIN